MSRIFKPTPESPTWSYLSRPLNYRFVRTSYLYCIRATFLPFHNHWLNTRIILDDEYKLLTPLLSNFSSLSTASEVLLPKISTNPAMNLVVANSQSAFELIKYKTFKNSTHKIQQEINYNTKRKYMNKRINLRSQLPWYFSYPVALLASFAIWRRNFRQHVFFLRFLPCWTPTVLKVCKKYLVSCGI